MAVPVALLLGIGAVVLLASGTKKKKKTAPAPPAPPPPPGPPPPPPLGGAEWPPEYVEPGAEVTAPAAETTEPITPPNPYQPPAGIHGPCVTEDGRPGKAYRIAQVPYWVCEPTD